MSSISIKVLVPAGPTSGIVRTVGELRAAVREAEALGPVLLDADTQRILHASPADAFVQVSLTSAQAIGLIGMDEGIVMRAA